MALNYTRMWLRGIIEQGHRIRANVIELKKTVNNPDSFKNYKVEIFQHLIDRQYIEEHFFIIAVGKTMDWLYEATKAEPSLRPYAKTFLKHIPDAKKMRNMREHDIDYFKGQGLRQSDFEYHFETDANQVLKIKATSTVYDASCILIGGKLDVCKTVKAAEDLYLCIMERLIKMSNKKDVQIPWCWGHDVKLTDT